MNDERLEHILARVRKLLALGQQTDNEHEAAAALGQAQRLMAEHAISEAMLLDADARDEIVIEDSEPLDVEGKRSQPWRERLANGIARANRCRVLLVHTRSQRALVQKAIRVVGAPSDIATVRYLYAYCVRETLRITGIRGRTRSVAWCNSFRMGMVEILVARMTREQREATSAALQSAHGKPAGAASVANAIVRLDARAAAASRVAKRQAEGRRVTIKGAIAERDGYVEGLFAGQQVELGSGPGLPTPAQRTGRGDGT